MKTMFGSYLWYPHLFVGVLTSYLRYLYLLAYSGVEHILCYVFALFVIVVCLVHYMLSVSLDCPFLIVLSVFSTVYLTLKENQAI